MILSHRHKFIFLKTRKTAGTSIEIALSRFCGDEDIISPISPPDEALRSELGYRGPQRYLASWRAYRPRDVARWIVRRKRKQKFYNHMTAAEVRRLAGAEVWEAYFKFCVERNPWDKVVSLYYHHLRANPRLDLSLSEFLERGLAERVCDFDSYTLNGQIAVDYLARYERLDEDLEQIRLRLQLPEPLSLPRAKAGFRTDKRPYQELFGPAERDWVARRFAREIAHCGYEF